MRDKYKFHPSFIDDAMKAQKIDGTFYALYRMDRYLSP